MGGVFEDWGCGVVLTVKTIVLSIQKTLPTMLPNDAQILVDAIQGFAAKLLVFGAKIELKSQTWKTT